ncbi:MAG TPA: hypothetical protein PKX10_08960 [Propioniciclava tarda]|nr:hypothetical protein [Propioniciclava tarda]HQA31535.1 hypothetical protein [Propioniciclava tarda]HQD60234.1 hypothetical protein [Propioniciclava tarda]
MRRGAAVAGVVGLVLAASGCGTPWVATGSAASSPTPTYVCTPLAGAPAPCTAEEFSKLQAQAQLAVDAQDVYGRFFAEFVAQQRKGGSTTTSTALGAVTGGPYLAAQQANLARLATDGLKITGDVKLVKLVPVAGGPSHGYETALLACIDATKAEAVKGATVVSQGKMTAETAYFKRDAGVLKIWDAEKADPGQC